MPQKNAKRPDDFTAPNLLGNQNSEAIYQGLRPLDKVSFDMEMKWGVGRLQELSNPETTTKFGSAKAKLDAAVIDGNPTDVAKRASVMIRGWQALEAEVIAKGRTPMPPDVWSVRDDSGKVAYAITKDTADAHRASEEFEGVKVYSLAEVVRIIEMLESKSPLVAEVKELFPAASIDKITNTTEYLNDSIPF